MAENSGWLNLHLFNESRVIFKVPFEKDKRKVLVKLCTAFRSMDATQQNFYVH